MNIGEVAEASGVSAKRIRHYEGIGLLPPAPRSASGYRTYDEADVHVLRFVARARDLGFTIERIRGLLDLWADGERRSAEVKALALEQAAALEKAAAALEAMRSALLHLAANCHGDHRPDCPIIDGLARGPGTADSLLPGAHPLAKLVGRRKHQAAPGVPCRRQQNGAHPRLPPK